VTREPGAVRAKVGLTGQFASVDEDLTGTENLILVGRLLGLPWGTSRERAGELLEAFGLSEASKRLVKTYSGGMRRRLDIAASLVTTPEVLFLDEPTSGLDPRSRNQVWDIVRGIAKEGTTVLLTTQYLEEADRLAQRMAVIDHGRIIAEGTAGDLKASVGGSRLHVRLRDPEQGPRARTLLSAALGGIDAPTGEPGRLAANAPDEAAATRALSDLSAAGIRVAEFSLGTPTLDEVFLTLTGKPAEDAAAAEGSK
jgi:ABC-2 type transport system ATP-binding protein